MDANGTHCQLLLGEDDWRACLTDAAPGAPPTLLGQMWDASPQGNMTNLSWNPERFELTLQRHVYRFPAPPHQVPPTQEARRGAACDRYGNWYWIGATGFELLVNSAGTKATSHWWSATDGTACADEPNFGDFRPRDAQPAVAALPLSGLAITEEHYLVVGVLAPKGLLVFDLHAGGPPRQLFWPTAVDFVPFDMAPAPGGGVWILDRANRRYWALDRHLNVIAEPPTPAPPHDDAFGPRAVGAIRHLPACAAPPAIRCQDAFALALHDPIAIEGLPDGTVLVLDRVSDSAASEVRRYRAGQQIGPKVALALGGNLIDPTSHDDGAVAAHDFAFVPEHPGTDGSPVRDRLYVAAHQGDQSFAFGIDQYEDRLQLTPLSEYLPMRLFGGRGVVCGCNRVYYDSTDRWVPLAQQCRPRYAVQANLYTPADATGAVGRRPFDAREPRCVWHRLLLDACVPPDAALKVWSRAADDPQDLVRSAWQPEPTPYLRGNGSEQPFVAPRTASGDGTWELLLQRARGRYLQLKLQLVGNGRTTPRLRALRVYFPRFSYLARYLPAVYRDDPASASFLDRFLANPEGTLTALEDKIAAVQILFDPSSALAITLDWLASWFGIALDPQWDERKRRLFLKYAMVFFQYRGTVLGLKMALHLVLDKCADESIFKWPAPTCAKGAPCCGTASRPRTAGATQPQPYRIVERFQTRQTPGIVFGDPSAGLLPAQVAATARWQPNQGVVALNALFTQGQGPAQTPGPAQSSGFPIVPDASQKVRWTTFCQITLGFVPTADPSFTPRWQDFLDRRYHAISALNRTYGTAYTAFTQVTLPTSLPADGPALVDWYQFQSVVLAMQRTAHRFTVLLPAPKEPDPDGSEHQRRRDLAQRVIDLEKPAHTVYDIQFYWAYFRVGQARLGDDSIIDRGSRSPELMSPTVLGRSYLASSYVASGHPQEGAERDILGRDPVRC